MPTVPTLPVGGSVPQERLPVLRTGVNPPQDAFGGGGEGFVRAGQSMLRASDRIDEIVRDRAERDNKVASKDAYLKFDDEANSIDRDLTSRKLTDAKGLYDEGKDRLKTTMAKYMDGLANPRQKELFQALAQSRYESMINRFNNHEQGQLEKADEMSSKAMIASAHQAAAKDPYNPSAIHDAQVKIEIGVETALKGADPETKRVARENEISKMHRGVAEAISASGNAQGAMDYMKKHSGDLTGDDLTALKKSLRDEVDTQNAQALADKAISKFGTDYGAAAEWITKNSSGGVENKALDQYRARAGMMKQGENERREKNAAAQAVAMLQAKDSVTALDIANGEKDEQTKLSLLKLHRDLYPVEKPKAEVQPLNVAVASNLRAGIDRFKETGQPVQIGGKAFSLGDSGSVALAASTLGLDGASTKDVLQYLDKGGLVGTLKETEVKSVFESLTDKKIEDKPAAYQFVLNYVKRWAPEGKEADPDTVRKLASQALLNFKSSSFEVRGDDELAGWNSAGSGKKVRPPAFAQKLGVNESLLVQRIQMDGGKVDPDTVDLYTRTWFMPQEARATATRILNENKMPVTEANIRAIWLRYGDTF